MVGFCQQNRGRQLPDAWHRSEQGELFVELAWYSGQSRYGGADLLQLRAKQRHPVLAQLPRN